MSPKGVGVGDPTATPTTALLHTIILDCLSRLATILFAARLGLALEPECKRYRLAADVFNDAAMLLDCLSPFFASKSVRVAVLAGGSVLRSFCGTAAGSAKASLSAHFARDGNLGELNAVGFSTSSSFLSPSFSVSQEDEEGAGAGFSKLEGL